MISLYGKHYRKHWGFVVIQDEPVYQASVTHAVPLVKVLGTQNIQSLKKMSKYKVLIIIVISCTQMSLE